jgi:hypothetical protein
MDDDNTNQLAVIHEAAWRTANLGPGMGEAAGVPGHALEVLLQSVIPLALE